MAVLSLLPTGLRISSRRQLLMLGTLAGLSTPAVQAAEPAPEAMLWSCVSVNDGKEWQCDVNEDATAQPEETITTEPATSATEPTQPATEQPAVAQQPEPPASQQPVVESDYQPPAEPLTLEPTKAPPRRQRRSGWQEYSTASAAPSAYECEAAGENWNCRQGTAMVAVSSDNKGYVAAYPDAYAASPSESADRGETPSVSRTSAQWDCKAGPDGQGWDCQQISGESATAAGSDQSPIAAPERFPYAYLDWYDFDTVDPVTHCSGRYIEPEQDNSVRGIPDEQLPTYVNANRSRTRGGNYTSLEGNVHLSQGDRQLRSRTAQLDHDNERAEFQGAVLFREPGVLILSDRAIFDQLSGTTTLENTQFVFQPRHLRGSASSILRNDNGETYITDGLYTRCEPGNESWTLNGSEIVLYEQEGYGVAKHATLKVAGVPVLYLPMIRFPIDDRRVSGFLIPSISFSEDNGLDVTAPYYFNLAPNYDMTTSPRYIEKRGLMLENEFRYLNEYSHIDLSMAALPGDDARNNDDRWLLGIDHNGSFGDGWSSRIDYTSVSDNDYFDELDTSLNISRETHLDQLATLGYNGGSWRFDSRVQSYQTITTASKPYRKLPELRLSGDESFEFQEDSPLDFSYITEYTRFDRDISEFTGTDRITGDRAHIEASISSEYSWPWAYVRPKLRMTHTNYRLSDQPTGDEDDPSRTLPLFSVDSGLYLDRDTEFLGKAYIHTLEPRLYYLYVPFEDQTALPDFDSSELTFSYSQLFRDNRFSGKDRIGDTNQLTLGVTSRLLEDNGQELLHASVGQIFYLEDREVRLNAGDPVLTDSTSNFAAEAVWRLNDDLRLTADGEWDNDDFQNIKRNLKLSYRSDIDHQFNFSYRFTRDSLEQTDISFIWPINASWSVLGRWLNDIENSESLDKILGVEYEDCCWQIRTVYRQWIDDDATDRENSGIFLQFTLKGLGTAGTRATGDTGPKAKNFLEDITGFEERENYE